VTSTSIRTRSGAATALITALAMVAFASNSVLARAALRDSGTDPGTFTAVRLGSGAAFLLLLVAATRGSTPARGTISAKAWLSGAALFSYAAGFSYAYLSLGAGTGALILFGVVQSTILGTALVKGERLTFLAMFGLVIALAGLVVLLGPGVSAPDPFGAALMVLAGLAWAAYTLRGRQAQDAVLLTASNFVAATPAAFLLLAVVLAVGTFRMTVSGLALAVASGVLASGLGYVLWYTVLPSLSRTTAGIVQLTPAPIAAVAGLLLIGEPITARVVAASILILAGVAMALTRPLRPT
jgi:drug/metabolite transporter (DMT)-like permease